MIYGLDDSAIACTGEPYGLVSIWRIEPSGSRLVATIRNNPTSLLENRTPYRARAGGLAFIGRDRALRVPPGAPIELIAHRYQPIGAAIGLFLAWLLLLLQLGRRRWEPSWISLAVLLAGAAAGFGCVR